MKRLISIVLILTMLMSLVACGQTGNPEDFTPNAETTLGHYPITVTDHAGREVTIEKEPQGIVSCYYITSNLLMALGVDEKWSALKIIPTTVRSMP